MGQLKFIIISCTSILKSLQIQEKILLEEEKILRIKREKITALYNGLSFDK